MSYPRTEMETYAVGDAILTVACDAGPRIVSYSNGGADPLFADLAGDFIDHPGVDPYPLIGGHRLWRAPEVPAITYEPDDNPVAIREFAGGIEVVGAPDRDGVVKSITAKAHEDMTVIDHALRNSGHHPVTTAAWAITQLSPGGVAILPQSFEATDPDGVLPNRSIAIWPYTDLSAPDIVFGSRDVRVIASATAPKLKIGTQNTRGWIAYHSNGALFAKWSPLHNDEQIHPDRGSSVECYRDHRFLELETLGPMVTLEPGDEVGHREVWQMIDVSGIALDEVLESLPAEPEAMRS